MIATCVNAREVVLREGDIALVDASDFEKVIAHSWRLSSIEDGPYAVTTIKSKNIRMHRMILGCSLSESAHIDHVDGNGLNNCRSNLRLATPRQNAWNRRLSARNLSSRFKSVRLKSTGKWEVRVRTESKCWCGTFDHEEHAARAYDVVASAWFGEFACLNFPSEIELSREIVRAVFRRQRSKPSQTDGVLFQHVPSLDELATESQHLALGIGGGR